MEEKAEGRSSARLDARVKPHAAGDAPMGKR